MTLARALDLLVGVVARPASLIVALTLLSCSGEKFASDGAGGAAPGGSGGAAGSAGSGGAAGTEAQPTSCKSLYASGVITSGPQVIEPYAGQSVKVYCEMTTTGGGWTLVARSVEGGNADGNFGWKKQAGAIDDPAAPYSLDVYTAGVEFQELMVAERNAGFGVQRAFVASVPSDYLVAYGTAPFQFNPPFDDVAGPCNPAAEVAMLSFGGHTDLPSQYAFRDHETPEIFGLLADGWNLAMGSECDYNGGLSGTQGMIFVR